MRILCVSQPEQPWEDCLPKILFLFVLFSFIRVAVLLILVAEATIGKPHFFFLEGVYAVGSANIHC